MNIRISFIIPVFNVEKYIERCILSIENQDIPRDEYELIVVNDGTQDNSVSIIQQLQLQYPNIRLINKENGGLSSARNVGVKHAFGKYIWFIDSDDYIDANVLRLILNKAYLEDLDVLGFGNKDIYPNGSIFYAYTHKPVGIVTGKDLLQHYELSVSACSFIAKRELYIKYDIQFTEGIYHEDYDFVIDLYEYCERIAYMRIYPYNYIVKSEGSITTSRNFPHVRKRLDSWISIINNIKSKYYNVTDPFSYSYYATLWCSVYQFHALSALLLLDLPLKEKKEYVRKFKEIGCFSIDLNCSLNAKRKLIVLLIYKHPFVYNICLSIRKTLNVLLCTLKRKKCR